jgi:crossover junction endodeoxyribonuclease RusA
MILISREARAYKQLILGLAFIWKRPKILGRISLDIFAYPPDRRARDLDNVLKVSIDSLQFAGLFENDSQIDQIFVKRCDNVPKGKLLITIKEII